MEISATAALIHLDPEAAQTLEACFSQFGIRSTILTEDVEQRVRREKFDACVLPLDEKAEPILQAIRSSPPNRRVMIYGVAGQAAHFLSLSKYGINILLESPLERQAALKAIRATHLLVVHEHRRYVRIPIAVAIRGETEAGSLAGTSREVSAGGMSITSEARPEINELLKVVLSSRRAGSWYSKVRFAGCRKASACSDSVLPKSKAIVRRSKPGLTNPWKFNK